MKSKFSSSWKSSSQPRKQVKYRANAPHHIKRKFMASHLDKPLREKYGRRNIEVRKGDEVKIMRGKFAKKHGKVSVVDVKNTLIQVDGAQRQKKGGEKLETWFKPSKVKIISLNLDDKKRVKSLERTGKNLSKKKTSKPEEKKEIKKGETKNAH